MSNEKQSITDLKSSLVGNEKILSEIKKFLDYHEMMNRVGKINELLLDPSLWADIEKTAKLKQEHNELMKGIEQIDLLEKKILENKELIVLLEDDPLAFEQLEKETALIDKEISILNMKRLFSDPHDKNSCYLTIQSGAGGTEAQDWASILSRMYCRYADNKGFGVEILDETKGDVAGIKKTTLKISGQYAYGYLRNENGIHRLIRKSPYNAQGKRQTSFSGIFVFPEIETDIEITINPSELRIDTYRSSGAGGQHVNTTDSAVRITHIPSGIVAQCQNDRSQHKNKASAMSILKSRLYQLEVEKSNEKAKKLEESKNEIGFGDHIRSYVIDQSRVVDARSKHVETNVKAVFDGDLDGLIRSNLLLKDNDNNYDNGR